MRKGSNNEIVLTDSNELLLFNLGADFCAEHEWGIKGINSAFAINNSIAANNVGIRRHMINQVPSDYLLFFEEGKEAILIFGTYMSWKSSDDRNFKYIKGLLRDDRGDDFYTGWSNDEFGIRVKGTTNVALLKELYEAFLTKDVSIWLGGGGVFKNAGLTIAKTSRLNADQLKTMLDVDEDRLKLNAASEDTGIIARLKEKQDSVDARSYYNKPCGYYACSAAWISADLAQRSAYPVMYWLNPQDQKNNNFAWCTVEDLDDWINGTGRIPKQ